MSQIFNDYMFENIIGQFQISRSHGQSLQKSREMQQPFGGVLSSMPTPFAHAAWYFLSSCVTLVLSIACHRSPGMFDSHLWSKEVNKVCT